MNRIKRQLIAAAALLLAIGLSGQALAQNASLSVFSNGLRPVFIAGEQIEMVVVFKTSVTYTEREGTLQLFEADAETPLLELSFTTPTMTEGRHVEAFLIDSTYLRPGAYTVVATVDPPVSNRYDITIAQRHRPTRDGRPGPTENPAYCYDLHATILHLLGIDHTRLVFRHNGNDRRLTDVHGEIIQEILA